MTHAREDGDFEMERNGRISELTEQKNLKDLLPEERGGGRTWLTSKLFPEAGTWDRRSVWSCLGW